MQKIKNLNIILKKLKDNNSISMLEDFSRRGFNPWKILISTILSARCTDEITMPTAEKLFKVYPTAKKLSEAKLKDIEKIIRPIGFFRNKSKFIKEASKNIAENKNKVPKEYEQLIKLPGVGGKVAGCVMVYAYNIPEIPVDTHVAVIAKRLGWTNNINPDKISKELKEKIPQKYWHLINELFVIHGKTICFKRNPKCEICPITKHCKYYKEK